MNKDNLLICGVIAFVVIAAVALGGVLKQVVVVPGATSERVVPVNQYVGISDSDIPVVQGEEDFGTGGGIRTINNRLRVGPSGADVVSILFATATRDFTSLTYGADSTSTNITVTGADVGDPCIPTKDASMDLSNFGTGVSTSTVGWNCTITAADTATISIFNNSTTTAKNLPSGTIGALVFDIF